MSKLDWQQIASGTFERPAKGLTTNTFSLDGWVDSSQGFIPAFALRPSLCTGCKFYHGEVYGQQQLVCAVHPEGWQGDVCPDWARV